MTRTNLFAYTSATGRGYPSYVSINQLENGDVQITVREPPKINEDCYGYGVIEGRIVSAIVPADEWKRAAIADTHAKRGDVKQAPSLMSGGGAESNRPTTPIIET